MLILSTYEALLPISKDQSQNGILETWVRILLHSSQIRNCTPVTSKNPQHYSL